MLISRFPFFDTDQIAGSFLAGFSAICHPDFCSGNQKLPAAPGIFYMTDGKTVPLPSSRTWAINRLGRCRKIPFFIFSYRTAFSLLLPFFQTKNRQSFSPNLKFYIKAAKRQAVDPVLIPLISRPRIVSQNLQQAFRLFSGTCSAVLRKIHLQQRLLQPVCKAPAASG